MTTAAADGAATSPLEYRVSAKAVRGGDAEVAAAQVVVPLDAGWATPPTGAPGPADLLGSAFAACLLKNLARAGALLGFEYDDARVDVVLRRQDAPPKFTHVEYALRVSTAEPERRVELVHTNLRKFGTVFNTLAAVCEVHGTVTAVPRTQKSGSARA